MLVQPRLRKKDLYVFCDISIQHKYIKCFFELSVSLSEKRLAALKIIWQLHLRESLIELLEKYCLFAD